MRGAGGGGAAGVASATAWPRTTTLSSTGLPGARGPAKAPPSVTSLSVTSMWVTGGMGSKETPRSDAGVKVVSAVSVPASVPGS